MNRKYGVTDAICFNLCEFLFSLKKKTPAEAFRQTVKICAENHIFSKDDILTMCKLMQHQGEEQELSNTDVHQRRSLFQINYNIIMEATITSALKALKMPGMAESWRVMEETHQLDKLSVREAMPLLLQAEMDNRETNRISKLIKGSGFRLTATI